MKKTRLLIMTMLFTGASTLLSAASAVSDTLFSATYKGKHSGINITLVRTLEEKPNSVFALDSTAKSFIGSIKETSHFSVLDHAILPHNYFYSRKVFGKKSIQKLNFDWKNMQAQFVRSDKPKDNKNYDLVPEALDPTLYQLKLQQELFKGNNTFDFDFAKKGRMKKMAFQLLPNKTRFALNGREFEAVEVERINQKDNKKTNIVLIPSLLFQIARITHMEEDGSEYKVELVDFQGEMRKLAQFYESITH